MIRPLDPLKDLSPIARLIKGAPAQEARAEVARLHELSLEPLQATARTYAEGALSLREGSLDAARTHLSDAAAAFERQGHPRAAKLARCEAILAAMRRGPRAVYQESVGLLENVKANAEGDALVEVVATHYRGTAERLLGDAASTQRSLLWALERSGPFLDEKAKVLNSLGTLYVVMGAHGAAQALLEHAAELHHQNGDVVGEAIAFGQLGSAALSLGDLPRARQYLQRQEWLCSRVGDVFGQARSLIFLADVALAQGRPDDAIPLATRAREIAQSAKPPLRLWMAYATRSLGRARMDMGDPQASAELTQAAALFAEVGNPLGAALTEWDRVRLAAKSGAVGAARAGVWLGPAWQLASLGLAGRVAEVLRDERAHTAPGEQARASELAVAAAAQSVPHISVAQEVDLVYGAPEELSRLAERRTSGQRNLARLSALVLASPGLYVAVVASSGAGNGKLTLPPERSAAASVSELPGFVVWVWRLMTPPVEVGRDLAALRVVLGSDTRAVLSRVPKARITSAPFAGEPGPTIEGADLSWFVATALSLPAAALRVGADIEWDREAEARAVMAGYKTTRG
jgi:tetratricopeptide (TPR) repeat protein